ncbi:MAG: putative tricarboxylic transport rane protein [Clostridiales bacterium]|jgi:tripartite-type tricarboxylate transporter receptor subunit TctC|nr:putative tricarboxylic transport rane protein [Clostridiales bacterium]MDK2933741.1 putative tricarboxylic transport rane protein [Clostridiales bacterium]
MKKVFVVMLVLVLVVSMIGCSAAQKYPKKQITLVIQAAPGGASDTVSRTVAGLMEKKLGVPVVGVNKTGAAGSVAMSYVKESKADGYTIGYVPVELSMVKALGYADISPKDYDLLGRAIVIPAAVTVKSDSPWKTLDDLIAYAKENPSKLKAGNSGTGSIWHIAACALEDTSGIKLNHVPFDGAAPAVAALLGGHVDVVTVSPSEVLSGVKSGELRVLGVMGAERSALIPDVPTLKESGLNANVVAWGGFAAPKGLPKEVREKLIESVKEAINSDDFKNLCEKRGMDHAYQDPGEFEKFATEQFDFYNTLIPKLGLKK